MTIPAYLEQLIHQGKAEAKVYTGGLAAQCEIPCPQGSYIVMYGYYYKPYNPNTGEVWNNTTPSYPAVNFKNSIQYVGIGYNGKFASFVHSVDLYPNLSNITLYDYPGSLVQERRVFSDIDVQERSCYIVSNTNIGISFAILNGLNINPNIVATLPNDEDIFLNLGYGSLGIPLTFGNYIAANPVPEFMSITYEKLEDLTSFAPGYNYSNQLYSNPGFGGDILDPAFYATGQSALGKARMPHINCLYVQVNEQKPANLL